MLHITGRTLVVQLAISALSVSLPFLCCRHSPCLISIFARDESYKELTEKRKSTTTKMPASSKVASSGWVGSRAISTQQKVDGARLSHLSFLLAGCFENLGWRVIIDPILRHTAKHLLRVKQASSAAHSCLLMSGSSREPTLAAGGVPWSGTGTFYSCHGAPFEKVVGICLCERQLDHLA